MSGPLGGPGDPDELKEQELREELAAYAHEAWSGWMRYLFQKARNPHEDGSVMIDGQHVMRWMRQMETDYADLPEEEKESDRREADKILRLLDDL